MQWFRVYRSRLQNQIFSKPSRLGAYGGCVTEGEGDGDGDGHSIYLRTLINQTQGLSADVIGRTNPEGVRQSSADSELRRGYDKKIKIRGEGARKYFDT